ncbi:hypothetical protein K492DRAFT_182547 [Lichtheimia hyalospora FSU 10163]|nr:hypothetical protein K492DRAFT_182547 [Lichtheimia hyalospora FSU 10163]
MITSGHSQMQAKSDTTVPSLSPEAIIESFRHRKHEDTLIITESLRQHHIEMLLTILKIRAATLARVADFEQALNETTIQMQIAPLSALGYLQSGDILSNMQGHQAAAINIYEKGISMVPQSDPYHQQLLQAKQQALAKQQIRVDFITQLPLALVQNWIAPLLRRGNKWRYLGTVSKGWYQVLMADNVDKKHFKTIINHSTHCSTLASFIHSKGCQLKIALCLLGLSLLLRYTKLEHG